VFVKGGGQWLVVDCCYRRTGGRPGLDYPFGPGPKPGGQPMRPARKPWSSDSSGGAAAHRGWGGPNLKKLQPGLCRRRPYL